jgi:DNA (cytosine-5)-methyltransferase 1
MRARDNSIQKQTHHVSNLFPRRADDRLRTPAFEKAEVIEQPVGRRPFVGPRHPKYTFIDLYAGIGGTRLGMQLAGGQCLFSSEWNRFAQVTYERNFGDAPVGDIRSTSPSCIPDHDILVAGFPCQPFSIAGVTKKNSLGRPHGFLDSQGMEFQQIARIVRSKKPLALLLENVRNLTTHDGGKTFQFILQTLDDIGYRVSSSMIDAARVVPQHRERVYIVGFRKDLCVEFKFPTIRRKKVNVSDVLEYAVNARYTLSDKLWEYLQGYARKHRLAGNGFSYGLVNVDGATRTLSARYYKDGAEILIPQMGQNPRRLTPRECARLMGFPERFLIPVSDRQAYQQFGNSAVVPIVKKIALAMHEQLEPWLAGQPLTSAAI